VGALEPVAYSGAFGSSVFFGLASVVVDRCRSTVRFRNFLEESRVAINPPEGTSHREETAWIQQT
jgi:hypothetical protein